MDTRKELFDSMRKKSIGISYTGPFDSQILSVLAKNIEYSLSLDPKLNKKIFKIFIELAQNIAFYSSEKVKSTEGEEMGYGTLTIQEFHNHFIFATGNKTTEENIKPVIEKCDTINSLGRKELREYKRQQRNLPPSERGGGNIGLIQVALTADNPIDYRVVPLNNNQLFYIVSVKIDKITE